MKTQDLLLKMQHAARMKSFLCNDRIDKYRCNVYITQRYGNEEVFYSESLEYMLIPEKYFVAYNVPTKALLKFLRKFEVKK